MLIKYKHTGLFVTSETEFSKIKVWDDIYPSGKQYKLSDFPGGFEMVFAVSRIFFQDEKHIPRGIYTEIEDISRVFQYGEDFIDKIASYKREEMDSFASRLREDDFCKKRNYVGMGLWVLLYE